MKILLKALKHVKEDTGQRTSGICGEVFKWLKEYCMVNEGENYAERHAAVEATMRELEATMNEWPRGGRRLDHRYPVEGGYYPFMAELMKGTLWNNPLRHELLDWLIKELENDAKPDSQHGSSSGER